ncbi:hypothetical protein [Azotobacter vinelandii]
MTAQPESTYVRIATALRPESVTLGTVKTLCLEMARHIDALLASLDTSNALAEDQANRLRRQHAENERLREQLEELQRLATRRGDAVADLLLQQEAAR